MLPATRSEPATGEARASQRVFFALWPDANATQSLHALASGIAGQCGGRPTPVERMHLTLAFMGNVEPDRLAVLARVGAEVASASAPFRLTLDRLGGFRDAEVAWLGASHLPGALEALVSGLRAALESAGFAVDKRRYRAHVTLARRCERIARPGVVAPVAWDVAAITLTASALSADGPTYTQLWRWPFAGSEG